MQAIATSWTKTHITVPVMCHTPNRFGGDSPQPEAFGPTLSPRTGAQYLLQCRRLP